MFEKNIEIIKNTFLEYKGTGMYIILFCIAIFYICLKEKNNNNKAFFIYFPIIILLITLNPLFNKIISPIFKESTYWRVYWMIPLIIEIAYASVLFINEQKEKNEKIISIIGVIAIIVISGKYTYTEENFFKTGNLYKLPDESVRIAQIIGLDESDHKKAIVSESIVAYIRQIDANIGLAYKREPQGYANNKFVLAMLQGDSYQIAKLAIENNCNYIVLKKVIPLTLDMSYFNFSVLDMTENYVIYKLNKLQ